MIKRFLAAVFDESFKALCVLAVSLAAFVIGVNTIAWLFANLPAGVAGVLSLLLVSVLLGTVSVVIRGIG